MVNLVNNNHNEILRGAAEYNSSDDKYDLRFKKVSIGANIDPRAKYLEAIYSNNNTTVTYNYYESSTKAELYNSIVVNYTEAQDTTLTSVEWL